MALSKCPDCGKDVSSEAVACPNCGRPTKAPPPPNFLPVPPTPVAEVEARSGIMDGVKIGCGMFIVLPILIFFGVILFVAGVASLSGGKGGSSSASKEKLEVVKGWTWEQDGDWTYVRGSVKNIGNTPITYFAVRAEYLNSKGAVVDTNYTNSNERVNPGARKKFEIMHRNSPDYKHVSVFVSEAR